MKELFVSKTGGSIQVFLSSDGESIPLGRNWVHQIEQALATTSLMFVFVTPASLKSSWLYFESGYAYSKEIRVVPVGFLGVDLASIPAPLNLLQGFNITSESGLNNIIAVANSTFQHNHGENFNGEEYRAICSTGLLRQDAGLGTYAGLLDEITFSIEGQKLLSANFEMALRKIAETFNLPARECRLSHDTLETQGITFRAFEPRGDSYLQICIDPGIADIALPLIENALRHVLKDGFCGVILYIRFVKGVAYLDQRHKLTGRLYGTGVKLSPDSWLRYNDMEFDFEPGFTTSFTTTKSLRRITAPYLKTRLLTDQIDLQQFQQLLDLLFEREILTFSRIGS
ncbi:TIR domain-containing protein [Nitrosospira briensis]|nr:TIR domain-containing protein [Nitrosospira briensis]